MIEFLKSLSDTSPYLQHWMGGPWSQTYGWLHSVSDLAIWGACMTIPIVLIYFVTCRRSVPFPCIFWFFGAFILSWGTGHLVEAGLFYWPVYRLSGAIKVVTALTSWLTVFAVIPVVPAALSMRRTDDLEAEVKKRTKELNQANKKLKQEIKKRQKIEAELRESEKRYEKLYEKAPDMFLSINPESSVIEKCNNTLAEKLGYDKDEIIGKPVFHLYHPDWHDQVKQVFKKFAINKTISDEELCLLSKDGQKIDVSLNVSAITDENGKILYSNSILRDITDRKRAEEKFHLAVESAPNAMVMVDEKGKIILLNTETERLFGYKRSELLGQKIEILVPGRFRKAHPPFRDDFCQHPKAREMGAGRDLFGLRKDGTEFPVEIGLNPIKSDKHLLILSSIIDITQRKKTEEQSKKQADELARSNKELEYFAYVASHDLQEPLRKIRSFTELLAKKYGDKMEEGAKQYLGFIVDGASRMHNLIQGLLNYSRIGRGEFKTETTNLENVMMEIQQDLQILISETRAKIKYKNLPTIPADSVQMKQLFQNLISNAIKYRSSEPPEIEITCRQQNGDNLFCVRDNGIGISQEYHDRVFLIFQRLHSQKAYPGTGLGLALCKKIVEVHGGRIWVESKPNNGSRFFFTLAKPINSRKA